MTRTLQLALLALLGLAGPVIALNRIPDATLQQSICLSFMVSCVGFFATRWLVPVVAAKTQARGICGKDLNKKGTRWGDVPIPEAVGLAPGCVFLLCVIATQMAHFYDLESAFRYIRGGFQAQQWQERLADSWLVDYNAALAAIGFMLFLGFVDDVLDVRWRVKLILPCFAALPLLVAYSGGTTVYVPKPLQAWLGIPSLLNLGGFYQLYMVLLVIFCSNSINILAGVNGLEAGQTFVVACAVLLHNLWELGGYAASVPSSRDGHLFSAFLMAPLATTTLGLLVHNWYPSSVFVGDTFTYFAGMAIAVAGILGHFSETLLLFLVPQVLNFLYSVPQLFGWVPCPRHRLPIFDPKTGLLRPKEQPDWNLVNLMLQLGGHCGENALCIRLLLMQAVCCGMGFLIRYLLAGVYK